MKNGLLKAFVLTLATLAIAGQVRAEGRPDDKQGSDADRAAKDAQSAAHAANAQVKAVDHATSQKALDQAGLTNRLGSDQLAAFNSLLSGNDPVSKIVKSNLAELAKGSLKPEVATLLKAQIRGLTVIKSKGLSTGFTKSGLPALDPAKKATANLVTLMTVVPAKLRSASADAMNTASEAITSACDHLTAGDASDVAMGKVKSEVEAKVRGAKGGTWEFNVEKIAESCLDS